MMKFGTYISIAAACILPAAAVSCKQDAPKEREITVMAPGHFHAALVQKHKIEGISDNVHVYAPEGAELNQYTDFIESFNGRADEPTSWNLDMHITDAPEADIPDSDGGIVVLAGKNNKKVDYIAAAIEHGYNVLTDKPMTIDMEGFEKLKAAYAKAKEKGLVIYDLMTERYDVLNIITRMLLADRELFGEFTTNDDYGSAVYMSSYHNFYKEVNGKPNIRPQWYYDTDQQGKGLADVTTHLIDLLFWQCFPGEAIHWDSDISNLKSMNAGCYITLDQFKKSTGASEFPSYLLKNVEDDILTVACNGSMRFNVKDIPVEIKVFWSFEGSDEGTFATYNGTNATINVGSYVSKGFVGKEIFIKDPASEKAVEKAVAKIAKTFPFVSVEKIDENEYHVIVPAEERTGHEEHFSLVANQFLDYVNGNAKVPEWEYANTLTKYRITAEAND